MTKRMTMMPSSHPKLFRSCVGLLTSLAIVSISISPCAANPAPATSTASTTSTSTDCERLTSLTYTQASAPSNVSAILSLIHSKINTDVTNVVGIHVEWSGTEIHKRVGERPVRCTVTRLEEVHDTEESQEASTRLVTQCYEVPFAIVDVDECALEVDHFMAHQCKEPAICINTLGSYECLCPMGEAPDHSLFVEDAATPDFWNSLSHRTRSAWELSLASSVRSSCPGLSSTYQCCEEDAHSHEGLTCRSSFRCPIDPCRVEIGESVPCSPKATCQLADSPLSHPPYTCVCPPGELGSGRPCLKTGEGTRPKVMYDGRTPTEETERLLRNGLICGCHVPEVDGCSGFRCGGKHEQCTLSDNIPTCACKPGHVHDPHYGCVDEHPPLLHIRPYLDDGTNPNISRLTQGDRYEEYGVDIIDDNAEEYLRSLKITYSRPLPRGCLLEMGQFDVNYTVATQWTSPEFVQATRTVVIENVNECLVKEGVGVGKNCPELVAMCDVNSGAICVDAMGTYSCKCPEGTEGDGFRTIDRLRPDDRGGFMGSMVPRNYRGGTGCRDTSPPVIEILGPNPKKFTVAKIAGLKGVMKVGLENAEMNAKAKSRLAELRSDYENDINFIIKATSGAELCATITNPNVRPIDCVRATDHTYKGIVDLSSRVSVGEPIPKDGYPLQWRVPYNVMDDAGNKAETVWRDVVVEEVDIGEFEKRARVDILADMKGEVDDAVNKALAVERRQVAATHAKSNVGSTSCPPCEACDCTIETKAAQSGGGADDLSTDDHTGRTACDSPNVMKDDFITTLSRHPWIHAALDATMNRIGPESLIILLIGCFIPTVLFIVWCTIALLFFRSGPEVQTYYHTAQDEEKERQMAQNVTYYPSPSSSNGRTQQTTPGSRTSASDTPRPPISTQRNGIFSSQAANGNESQQHLNGQKQEYVSPFRTDGRYPTRSPLENTAPLHQFNLRRNF